METQNAQNLKTAQAGNEDELVARADGEWKSLAEPLLRLGSRTAECVSNPADRLLRYEMYRLLFSGISMGYVGLFLGDEDHPDFWPMLNGAFNVFGPNPDYTYQLAPLNGSGTYRLSGFRGTSRMVDFQIAGGTLLPQGIGNPGATFSNYDLDTLHIADDGSFEVLLSNARPEGYSGDWWRLDPQATNLIVRQLSCDWINEADGRFAIERLDTPSVRPRQDATHIEKRLRQVADWAENHARLTAQWIARYPQSRRNKVELTTLGDAGGLSQARQAYIEGLFDIGVDEALIYETEVPSQCRYWNIQLTDMNWGAIDYVNRQTHLNCFTAKIDSDGKFRAVVSASDPGVANWLDTAGFAKGSLLGRWLDSSSTPTPVVTKVFVAELDKYLPDDTHRVTAEEREAALRLRRRGAQLRRRW